MKDMFISSVIIVISMGIVIALRKRYSLKDSVQGVLAVVIGLLLYISYLFIVE